MVFPPRRSSSRGDVFPPGIAMSFALVNVKGCVCAYVWEQINMYIYIYIYGHIYRNKYGIPFFGTNPYPTKQIKGNFIIFKSADWEGKCWFAGGYVGISGDGGEEKKQGIRCAGVIWCVFLF